MFGALGTEFGGRSGLSACGSTVEFVLGAAVFGRVRPGVGAGWVVGRWVWLCGAGWAAEEGVPASVGVVGRGASAGWAGGANVVGGGAVAVAEDAAVVEALAALGVGFSVELGRGEVGAGELSGAFEVCGEAGAVGWLGDAGMPAEGAPGDGGPEEGMPVAG